MLFGLNVPVPLLDQIPALAPPEILPFKGIPLGILFAHTVELLPAFTIGDAVKFNSKVSATAIHVPPEFPVEVNINRTGEIEFISAMLGI